MPIQQVTLDFLQLSSFFPHHWDLSHVILFPHVLPSAFPFFGIPSIQTQLLIIVECDWGGGEGGGGKENQFLEFLAMKAVGKRVNRTDQV